MNTMEKKDLGRYFEMPIDVPEELSELIPGFIENRRRDTRTLEEYLQTRNFEEIRKLGHTLKGLGSGYGFEALSAIGVDIEESAKARSPNEISDLHRVLVTYLTFLDGQSSKNFPNEGGYK